MRERVSNFLLFLVALTAVACAFIYRLIQLLVEEKESFGVITHLDAISSKTGVIYCRIYLEEEKDTIKLRAPKELELKQNDQVMLILKRTFLGDLRGTLVQKV